MEAERLVGASGFFLSSMTTISLAILTIEYIRSYFISLFPFSFIAVLYLLSLYLRSLELRKAGKSSSDGLIRISFLTTPILGASAFLLFVYFGIGQNTTFPLDHYSFNYFFMTIASLWAAYSLIEIYSIDKLSNGYRAFKYVTFAGIALTFVSIAFIGYLEFLLPAALLLISFSTFILGLRVYSYDYTSRNKTLKGKYH